MIFTPAVQAYNVGETGLSLNLTDILKFEKAEIYILQLKVRWGGGPRGSMGSMEPLKPQWNICCHNINSNL